MSARRDWRKAVERLEQLADAVLVSDWINQAIEGGEFDTWRREIVIDSDLSGDLGGACSDYLEAHRGECMRLDAAVLDYLDPAQPDYVPGARAAIEAVRVAARALLVAEDIAGHFSKCINNALGERFGNEAYAKTLAFHVDGEGARSIGFGWFSGVERLVGRKLEVLA